MDLGALARLVAEVAEHLQEAGLEAAQQQAARAAALRAVRAGFALDMGEDFLPVRGSPLEAQAADCLK